MDVGAITAGKRALVPLLAYVDFEAQTLRVHPALTKFLSMYGVSHVLSPFPQEEATFALVSHDAAAYVYRVDGAARVRFVRAARHVITDQQTARRLLDSSFDPDREILLSDAPDSVHPTVDEVEMRRRTPAQAVRRGSPQAGPS